MKPLNFILVLIIIFVIYLIGQKYIYGKKEAFVYDHDYDKYYIDKGVDDLLKFEKNKKHKRHKKLLNKYFNDIKFHNDYRDVLTAFYLLVPHQKQIFNLPNIPLIYSEPSLENVKDMINDFINTLNLTIDKDVPHYINTKSDWNTAMPDPNISSGWEKVQQSLGLPPSLYQRPILQTHVNLLSIFRIQKYETDDEIKYVITMVLSKENVKDQMILKVSFVEDKRIYNEENNFFKDKENSITKMVIEEFSIVGFLSEYGEDIYVTDKDDLYNFEDLEKNDFIDNKKIVETLNDRYKKRMEETDFRNAMLDEDGRVSRLSLDDLTKYESVKGTRNIFDDMKCSFF